MTRLEWIIACYCVGVLIVVALSFSRVDPLSAGKFIFQEHGWDSFQVCRRIGETVTCRTVGEVFDGTPMTTLGPYDIGSSAKRWVK